MTALKARWDHFWFQASYLPERVALLRVAFFGLLAFDLWMLMIPHAPRYGAGGFNVSHSMPLDPYLPVPPAMLIGLLYAVGGFLSLRIALGIASRSSRIALTAIYGGVYFWSQTDSYQHHYLIAIILLVSCFVPFEQTTGIDSGDRPVKEPIRSWALKLLYAEVAVVYLFTAITKTAQAWLDGTTVKGLVQPDSVVHEFQVMLGGWLGGDVNTAYIFAAHAIMIWQITAAIAFIWPKLRPIACLTGPAFHILVEVLGLKIGWFSYYMIALYYILLFPDSWFQAIARPVSFVLRPLAIGTRWLLRPRETPIWLQRVFALVTAALVGWVTSKTPMESAGGIAVVLGVLTALSLWPWTSSPRAVLRSLAYIGMAVALPITLTWSDAGYDYYRFQAGDLARRGDIWQAVPLYEKANALRPELPARRKKLIKLYTQMAQPKNAARVKAELDAIEAKASPQ